MRVPGVRSTTSAFGVFVAACLNLFAGHGRLLFGCLLVGFETTNKH